MSLITECVLYEKERKINGKVYEQIGIKVVMKNGETMNYLYVEAALITSINDKLYLRIQLLHDFVIQDILIDLADIGSIGIKYRERGD